MGRSFVGPFVVLVTLAAPLATGCEEELPRVGAGEYCQRDDQCLGGLVCLTRRCTMPPAVRSGPPTLEDAGPPIDAGTDAGPEEEDAGPEEMDAGTDAGPAETDAGTDAGPAETDAGTDAA